MTFTFSEPARLQPSEAFPKIATLLDREREGRFVVAFCPICDHAEEAEDKGAGRDQAESASISKIKQHLLRRHRAKAGAAKKPALARA